MEYVSFEVILHFEPELEGSISDLKKRLAAAILRYMDDVQDIEIETLESGTL